MTHPTNQENKEHCTIPPEGWYCTCAKGHEGPCAARENWEKKFIAEYVALEEVNGTVRNSPYLVEPIEADDMIAFIRSIIQSEREKAYESGYNLAKFQAKGKCILVGETEDAVKIFNAIDVLIPPSNPT